MPGRNRRTCRASSQPLGGLAEDPGHEDARDDRTHALQRLTGVERAGRGRVSGVPVRDAVGEAIEIAARELVLLRDRGYEHDESPEDLARPGDAAPDPLATLGHAAAVSLLPSSHVTPSTFLSCAVACTSGTRIASGACRRRTGTS